MLGLVTGIRKWDHLLGARRFRIQTDSSPLTYMLTLKNTKNIIQQWLQELSSYNFYVVHKAGRLNVNADGISRSPHMLDSPTEAEQKKTDQFETYVNMVHARAAREEDGGSLNSWG